ncbi:hypothetical protein I4U23_025642 [Adineta vaga]|nr:hypothetical protein I4U23_025642 [Adineta vaga]
MNQVQIRQVPITPSTSPERTPGAWFPTGYYGHFRAKPRIDLSNSFRQLARPNPPKIFIERQTSAATTHKFSDHDNRHKYEADPLIRGAQTGIGRRRSKSRASGVFDPFLIGWLPKDADRKTYVDEIKISSYANDYSHDSIPSSLTTTFDVSSMNPTLSKSLPDIQQTKPSSSKECSIYQAGFSHGQPDAEHSKKIREETFQRYAGTAIRRAQIRQIDRSTNVATCLAWNSADSDVSTTTKTNDKPMNVDVHIPSQTRINSSIEINHHHQSNPYHSESMPTFKNIERPTFDITPLREYYNVKVVPPLRRATSFIQPHTNAMESLITKYM